MFLNLTFLIIIVIVGIFMTIEMSHSTFDNGNICGPYELNTYGL